MSASRDIFTIGALTTVALAAGVGMLVWRLRADDYHWDAPIAGLAAGAFTTVVGILVFWIVAAREKP